jgi:hypothetical protein
MAKEGNGRLSQSLFSVDYVVVDLLCSLVARLSLCLVDLDSFQLILFDFEICRLALFLRGALRSS